MQLTASNLISIAAMIAAIIGSAAVAKFKLNTISEQVKTLFKCKTDMDHRLDLIESSATLIEHRLSIITGILSPDNLDKHSREVAVIKNEIDHLKKR
tara:strand:+ start:293 stop:583 length:291 start_codon:yes stop_codon:yes gene_type:complete